MANNYAIDVPNLIDALQNGGATMATIGKASIQETAAMATAANVTIQNGSEVGNALKSLTSNFQGLSTSAKDGSIVLTKAGVALREVAGVDLYSDKQKGQLKSMTQIYEELAEKWNTYTDAQKAAIASSVAGKTRSSVFSALMENFDVYQEIMDSFAKGDQWQSAEKENAKYIDSINGQLAKLKATWTEIASTVFNSEALKSAVGGLNTFSEAISTVVKAVDEMNMGIPAAIASIGLLVAAFKSFKYAGSFAGGIEYMVMNLASIPTTIAGIPGAVTSALSSFTGLSVTMSGLIGVVGGLAAAFLIFKGIQVAVDNYNTKATKKYEELTKSVNEHKKALSEATKNENNLSSLYDKYQKLSNVTNKTTEQQQEYNDVLKQLAEIDPDLVVYDENGSPIKARTGEVQDLIREYQKAQREQERLLQGDLKDKADTSFEKYKEQAQERNKEREELAKIAKELQNPTTGQEYSGQDMVANALNGSKEAMKNAQKYFDNLKKYKEEEKKFIDDVVKQRQSVNKDQSAWLENLFGTNDDLENAGKKRQQAIENALKLDFSQFNADSMEQLGNKMNEWFASADYADMGTFNTQIEAVNKLNDAWKSGSISGDEYKNSVNAIAKQLSELTGGKISTEEFAKMLKLPEFDVEDAEKKYSDLDEAKQTLQQKILDLYNIDTPEGRIELAYEIVQDEKTPEDIKKKVKELTSDGKITDEELQVLLKLVGQLDDSDLENTINEDIDKLSEEKEVTKDIAVKYALMVEDGGDFNQYLEELLGDANLAMDIQVHMDTGDLDLLKDDLNGLPTEKQVGIIVSAWKSGDYSIDQLHDFIHQLPESVQTQVIAELEAKGDLTPEQLEELKTGSHAECTITADTRSAEDALNQLDLDLEKLDVDKTIRVTIEEGIKNGNIDAVLDAVDKLPKEKQIQVLANIESAMDSFDEVDQKKISDKIALLKGDSSDFHAKVNSVNKTSIPDKTVDINGNKAPFEGVWDSIKKIPAIEKVVNIVGNVASSVTKWLSSGTGNVPTKGSVGDFTNISDTPEEVSTQAEGFSEISTTPTQASDTTGREVSTKASSFAPIDFVSTTKTTATKISTSLKNALNSIKYGVDLFTELNNRIERTQNNLDLLSAKMENAVGTKKISYLKQQVKLYEEQAKLQEQLYKKSVEEKRNLAKQVKSYGFTINDQGNISNYEEQMIKLEKQAEAAEKAVEAAQKAKDAASDTKSNYKGKSEKTKTALEKQVEAAEKSVDRAQANADKVKERLETIKDVTQEYLDLQYSEIPEAKQQWQELQNAIKEANDEIEKLTRENKVYKFTNAIKQANNAMDTLNDKMDLLDVKMQYANDEDKISMLKQQTELVNKSLKEQQKIIDNLNKKIKVYQTDLKKYGAKFDSEGNISNLSSLLNKYQNSEDLEKINDLVDEYNEMVRDDLPDSIKNYEELNNTLKEIAESEQEIVDARKDALKEQLNSIADIEEKITAMIKKQVDDRKQQLEDQKDAAVKAAEEARDAQLDAINKVKDAYNKQKDENDYNKKLSDQQGVIADLNKQIELARRDTSISGRAKLEELLEKLAEEEQNLQEIVQDRADELINDMFDQQIDQIESSSEEQINDIETSMDESIKALEDMWTDAKIAELADKALNTGQFEDIYGNITNLQDALINYMEESGEAIGVLADLTKNELVESLKSAVEYAAQYKDIVSELGLKSYGGTNSNINSAGAVNKSVNIDTVNFSITSETGNPEEIGRQIQENLEQYMKNISDMS